MTYLACQTNLTGPRCLQYLKTQALAISEIYYLEPKIKNGSLDPDHAPFMDVLVIHRLGLDMVNQCTKCHTTHLFQSLRKTEKAT